MWLSIHQRRQSVRLKRRRKKEQGMTLTVRLPRWWTKRVFKFIKHKWSLWVVDKAHQWKVNLAVDNPPLLHHHDHHCYNQVVMILASYICCNLPAMIITMVDPNGQKLPEVTKSNNQMVKWSQSHHHMIKQFTCLLKDVLGNKYHCDSGTLAYFDPALALRGGQPHCLRCVQSNVQVTWRALYIMVITAPNYGYNHPKWLL